MYSLKHKQSINHEGAKQCLHVLFICTAAPLVLCHDDLFFLVQLKSPVLEFLFLGIFVFIFWKLVGDLKESKESTWEHYFKAHKARIHSGSREGSSIDHDEWTTCQKLPVERQKTKGRRKKRQHMDLRPKFTQN